MAASNNYYVLTRADMQLLMDSLDVLRDCVLDLEEENRRLHAHFGPPEFTTTPLPCQSAWEPLFALFERVSEYNARTTIVEEV